MSDSLSSRSSSQSVMTMLETVVGSDPRHIADWNSLKAPPHAPLAQFHKKFWGIKEEAGLSNNVEIDDSTDDEIHPGCYVLDINIRGVELKKIWVRADYIRMFKYAEKFYADNLFESPCLVITGQPGIGKTLWLWYALRVCCAQKKPVIIYWRGTCWLFVQEGVFKQPPDFEPTYYQIVIWTLVDSTDAPSGPPMGLVARGTQHFILYSTSPTPSRWGKIHQTMFLTVCVMNPWTKAEIDKAAPFRASGVPLPAIEAIFYELGPTPRLCFGKNLFLRNYRFGLEDALNKLSLTYLEDLASRDRWSMDDVSHKIFMMRRVTIDVDDPSVDIQVISPFVDSKIASRMRALERHQLVSLFKRYHALPSTRKLSGNVFEAYCHLTFSRRIGFHFVPMVHFSGQPIVRAKKIPRWYSSHDEFIGSPSDRLLEALRLTALAQRAPLAIYPSRVVECDSKEIAERGIEANTYYVLIRSKQVGIDSFIYHNGILYLFQMTVSDTHSISDKLWSFLCSLHGLPPKHNWRFIFVKPPGGALACPVPDSDELLNLGLFSAEVDVVY